MVTRSMDLQFLSSLMQLKLGLRKEWEGMSEPNTYNPKGIQRRGNTRRNAQLLEEVQENAQMPLRPLGSFCSGKVDHIPSLFCYGEFKQCWQGGPDLWITVHRKMLFASNTCHQLTIPFSNWDEQHINLYIIKIFFDAPRDSQFRCN